jgi:sulfur-oxidizing protein SoxZ
MSEITDIRPRVRVPRTAAPGETINIRCLANHPMHNGHVVGADGAVIPRHIINRFTCMFGGQMVLDIAIEPSLSANPYFEFNARVDSSGTFEFAWHDDSGTVFTTTAAITVA